MSIFEMGMLICFGASWPFSVYRTWKTKTSESKSMIFLWLVFVGYLCGIAHKVFYYRDVVILLYILNGLLVFTDICLCYRYRK